MQPDGWANMDGSQIFIGGEYCNTLDFKTMGFHFDEPTKGPKDQDIDNKELTEEDIK